MRTPLGFVGLLVLGVRLVHGAPDESAAHRSHSHNDYERPHPLQDALVAQMGSVEADVFLVAGDLLVAHSRPELSPERTLRGLYLEPLRARCAQGRGRVYPDRSSLILLVDIKADPTAVYRELRRQLAPYDELLTHWTNGRIQAGAITVLLSGNRPRADVAAQTERVVALDGDLSDLDRNPPADLVPLISILN